MGLNRQAWSKYSTDVDYNKYFALKYFEARDSWDLKTLENNSYLYISMLFSNLEQNKWLFGTTNFKMP